jgi:cyanophycinase-like exopeptidase
MKNTLLFLFFIQANGFFAQNYTSYFTGNPTDMEVTPLGGICLMGGASEHDEAMRWFLQQSNGGDILVLRATGSDGYNDYLYSDLGINVNSVETIVCYNAMASQESYLQEKIQKAEAIWFAGGDQWTYISYWRNTPVDSLINKGITERNLVIGGTSAGMAIQGGYYFSAENGTVTSTTALANPYTGSVTVSDEPFLNNWQLSNVITDTHYDNPDRKGRHVVFLSRLMKDHQYVAKGIACDEYTAVCIPPNGICKIYGEYPQYDEDVYFIQPNCDLLNLSPEQCEPNIPLTWNYGGQALKVYHAKGTINGSQTFDLNTWNDGIGGVWENWYVQDGILSIVASDAPICSQLNNVELPDMSTVIFPNPSKDQVKIEMGVEPIEGIKLFTLSGNEIEITRINHKTVDLSALSTGIYVLEIKVSGKTERHKLFVH